MLGCKEVLRYYFGDRVVWDVRKLELVGDFWVCDKDVCGFKVLLGIAEE